MKWVWYQIRTRRVGFVVDERVIGSHVLRTERHNAYANTRQRISIRSKEPESPDSADNCNSHRVVVYGKELGPVLLTSRKVPDRTPFRHEGHVGQRVTVGKLVTAKSNSNDAAMTTVSANHLKSNKFNSLQNFFRYEPGVLELRDEVTKGPLDSGTSNYKRVSIITTRQWIDINILTFHRFSNRGSVFLIGIVVVGKRSRG